MSRIDQLLSTVQQQELAEGLGVDPSYLSCVFNGKREPSARLVAGLRDEFDKMVPEGQEMVTVDEVCEWLDMRLQVPA